MVVDPYSQKHTLHCAVYLYSIYRHYCIWSLIDKANTEVQVMSLPLSRGIPAPVSSDCMWLQLCNAEESLQTLVTVLHTELFHESRHG